MKDRILVVEDDFCNCISALVAFDKNENVENVLAAASLTEALKQVEEFRPTLALLDVHIKEGKGTAVGAVLTQKNIPYVYVTGVEPDGNHSDGHDIIAAIEIQDASRKTLARFITRDKDADIWKAAYDFLKN
jgi:CheY-like chemotaxis protein